MCGIAGYWGYGENLPTDTLQKRIAAMTQILRHRGPDSGGLWIQTDAGLALGHRRLAIRDLSPLGHQPMTSPDGRYVLSYNGEIYNTAELCDALDRHGVRPRGTSDTEVVLLSCAALGVDATLDRLLGMFAFALWDRKERRLTLARDRFGVKPLYWMRENRRFCFASELKGLRVLSDWHPELDHDALALLLRYGYIPAPHCIWKGAFKLPAAHRLDIAGDGTVTIRRYWDALAVVREGLRHPLELTPTREEDAVAELDGLLTDAVRRRMIADVPVGAFLSGGIDSSAITALMQQCSATPVQTFCIGFEEADYDEAPYAAAVARHLGTKHTELYLTAHDAQQVIPDLPVIYDEPFADASQIPTTLLSALTRRSVTTALTGDGGDELFAGYGRYAECLQRMPRFSPVTVWRRGLAAALRGLKPATWDALCGWLPSGLRPRNPGVRLHNHADLVLEGSPHAFYHRYFMQYWWHPSTILRTGAPPPTLADDRNLSRHIAADLPRMQYVDTMMYLGEDILTKVDRASMRHSLETRVPLLDVRVFEWACRIPDAWRMRNGAGKYLLRRVLHRYVPPILVERPKMGFGIPVGQWLRGSLREWVEDLLSEERLRREGIFRPAPVREAWQRHAEGRSNWEYLLWILLMFQAWHAAPPPSPSPTETDLPVTVA